MLLRILVLACTILVVEHGANNHVPATTCDKHEFYQKCENYENEQVTCEFTCKNFRLPKKEMCDCEAKCVCLRQYVRDTEENKCVYRYECRGPDSWWPWTN